MQTGENVETFIGDTHKDTSAVMVIMQVLLRKSYS